MRKLCVSIGAAFLAGSMMSGCASAAAAKSSTYLFQCADTSSAPRIDRLVVELGARERSGKRAGQWVRVDARNGDGRLVGYEILVDDTKFLQNTGVDPRIRRYVLYPSGTAPVEYVRADDGSPMLPQVAPRDWIPRPAGRQLQSVSFLGRTFTRSNARALPASWPRAKAVRLVLDPNVLVATSRDFKDDGTGMHGKDYRWVPLTTPDYNAMLVAGFNYLCEPHDLRSVGTLPVFIQTSAGWKNAPDALLRGNLLGAVMFSDEPAVHVVGDWRTRSVTSPDEVASAISETTRATHEGDGKYGRGFLARQLERAGVRYGEVRPIPYPAWDAIASSAWYQLEGGAGGWCFESRLDPKKFAANCEHVLGVPFPPDAESCIRLHVAVARGAARHFQKPWGFAVFGQMDSAAANVVFPITYDAGATYFWFWTSDDGHHVPWTRQLQLARGLRAYQKAHPRGDPAVVSRQATAAIVLPWGYALDDWTLSERGQLWDIPALSLAKKDASGAAYRDVLAAAMHEAVGLLQRRVAFDVLFLHDDEKADGYTEVHRVSADGTVKVNPPR